MAVCWDLASSGCPTQVLLAYPVTAKMGFLEQQDPKENLATPDLTANRVLLAQLGSATPRSVPTMPAWRRDPKTSKGNRMGSPRPTSPRNAAYQWTQCCSEPRTFPREIYNINLSVGGFEECVVPVRISVFLFCLLFCLCIVYLFVCVSGWVDEFMDAGCARGAQTGDLLFCGFLATT